jgi:hypothetical protein
VWRAGDTDGDKGAACGDAGDDGCGAGDSRRAHGNSFPHGDDGASDGDGSADANAAAHGDPGSYGDATGADDHEPSSGRFARRG